jgi:hypothetical protein
MAHKRFVAVALLIFSGTVALVSPPSIPEPAAAILFGAGLVGFATLLGRRKRHEPERERVAVEETVSSSL